MLCGLSCTFLAGCAGKSEEILSINDYDDTKNVCHKAKLFVLALDYILRSGETERIDAAFRDLGFCLAEDQRPDWGVEADSMEELAGHSGEVKAFLKESPPNLEDARPIVDEMIKVADKLPGGKAVLQETWINLRRL
jgi:hypothetical protein